MHVDELPPGLGVDTYRPVGMTASRIGASGTLLRNEQARRYMLPKTAVKRQDTAVAKLREMIWTSNVSF